MFNFLKKDEDTDKKVINSSEYDNCLKRISEIHSAVETLKSSVENIRTDVASLRGKFNQRFKGVEDKPTEIESFNNSEIYMG